MPQTLLFADDSVTMRRVMELTFAEQGFGVVSVADGQQAIDQITSAPPALALISVSLQRVNGFDVARFVRDHAKSSLPVLLLAGAFDQLDDARVRESGAAGVLVKPFEPAVVIKRVKELLGMKSSTAVASETTGSSASGRLVTSDEPSVPASADAAVATPPAGDYFTQLDAAFESLDAQLAERPTHGAGALHPHAAYVRAEEAHVPAANGATPAFEVDTNWFNKPAGSTEASDEFVVTRASDYAGATDDDRSWAPPLARSEMAADDLAVDEPIAPLPGPSAPAFADEASSAPVLKDARAQRPSSDSAFTHAEGPAATGPAMSTPPATAFAATMSSLPNGGSGSPASAPPAAPAFGAADAFAMLWAQEQGEPVPGAPVAPPVDLSEQSIDALTSQLSSRVGTRLSGQLLEPLTAQVSDRVIAALGSRVSADLTALGDRMSSAVADRLTERLGDRLANGLAERVAELVADRVMQSAFGDALRQTVNEVAERVVRAEIERIRAAAEARRSS